MGQNTQYESQVMYKGEDVDNVIFTFRDYDEVTDTYDIIDISSTNITGLAIQLIQKNTVFKTWSGQWVGTSFDVIDPSHGSITIVNAVQGQASINIEKAYTGLLESGKYISFEFSKWDATASKFKRIGIIENVAIIKENNIKAIVL